MTADLEDAANALELLGGSSAEADELRRAALTERQRSVCDLVTQGMSSKQIARHLGISHRTVETHRGEIYRRLGVHNAIQLIRKMFVREVLP